MTKHLVFVNDKLRPKLLKAVRHTVTYRAISIAAYLVKLKGLPQISGAKHLPLDQIDSLPVSNLTRKIARTAILHLSNSESNSEIGAKNLKIKH